MRNINTFISEGLKVNSKSKFTKDNFFSWWDSGDYDRFISKEELMKYIKKALDISKVGPKDIQDEISVYKDPSDLWVAYNWEDLKIYFRFEEKFRELISKNHNYAIFEEDICEIVFEHIYDICEDIIKKL